MSAVQIIRSIIGKGKVMRELLEQIIRKTVPLEWSDYPHPIALYRFNEIIVRVFYTEKIEIARIEWWFKTDPTIRVVYFD